MSLCLKASACALNLYSFGKIKGLFERSLASIRLQSSGMNFRERGGKVASDRTNAPRKEVVALLLLSEGL